MYTVVNKYLGVPYMGSKRLIAFDLLIEMLKYKPKARYFIDVFGGGGAVSFCAAQMGYKVIYNDYDTNLVNFMQFILERREKGKYGYLPDDYYKFVGRGDFNHQKDQDTVYSEFCRVIYSFGNTRRGYIFSKYKENYKKLLHNIVFYNCKGSQSQLSTDFNIDLCLTDQTYIPYRYSYFKKQLIKYDLDGDLCRLQNLERIQCLERIVVSRLGSNIELYNDNYQNLDLSKYRDEDVIIYCDPPYKNTAGYLIDFNSDDFYNWFEGLSQLSFLSEYAAPFSIAWSINKRCTLKYASNAISTCENLYINRDAQKYNNKLF